MSKRQIIILAIIAVFVILVTILIVTIFSRNRAKNNYFNQLIATKDSLIASTQREREAYKIVAENTRTYLEQIHISDSTSMANLLYSQKIFQQTINAQLKNIPINIARISGNDDSIRAAFRGFN